MTAQIGFDTITVTPSADVATNGTIDFTYPSGRAEADYAQSGESLVSHGLQTQFAKGASNFSLSYASSKVTLTYLGATSLPAGKTMTLQLPLAAYQQITDNTGGTAGNALSDVGSAFSQATLNNNFASLARKVNMLIANAGLFDKIPH
jgi:hypothetical protein